MLAYRYVFLSFCWYIILILEVAIARGEEARQLASVKDASGDSRMGRYDWDMESVRRWKRKLEIQHREYKAVCCCSCCCGCVYLLFCRRMLVLWPCMRES